MTRTHCYSCANTITTGGRYLGLFDDWATLRPYCTPCAMETRRRALAAGMGRVEVRQWYHRHGRVARPRH